MSGTVKVQAHGGRFDTCGKDSSCIPKGSRELPKGGPAHPLLQSLPQRSRTVAAWPLLASSLLLTTQPAEMSGRGDQKSFIRQQCLMKYLGSLKDFNGTVLQPQYLLTCLIKYFPKWKYSWIPGLVVQDHKQFLGCSYTAFICLVWVGRDQPKPIWCLGQEYTGVCAIILWAFTFIFTTKTARQVTFLPDRKFFVGLVWFFPTLWILAQSLAYGKHPFFMFSLFELRKFLKAISSLDYYVMWRGLFLSTVVSNTVHSAWHQPSSHQRGRDWEPAFHILSLWREEKVNEHY